MSDDYEQKSDHLEQGDLVVDTAIRDPSVQVAVFVRRRENVFDVINFRFVDGPHFDMNKAMASRITTRSGYQRLFKITEDNLSKAKRDKYRIVTNRLTCQSQQTQSPYHDADDDGHDETLDAESL